MAWTKISQATPNPTGFFLSEWFEDSLFGPYGVASIWTRKASASTTWDTTSLSPKKGFLRAKWFEEPLFGPYGTEIDWTLTQGIDSTWTRYPVYGKGFCMVGWCEYPFCKSGSSEVIWTRL